MILRDVKKGKNLLVFLYKIVRKVYNMIIIFRE